MSMIAGAPSPTESVLRFTEQNRLFQPSRQFDAGPRNTGLRRPVNDTIAQLRLRSDENPLVQASGGAMIQPRDRLQQITNQYAAERAQTKGQGGQPYNYQSGAQTYQRKVQIPYALQQVGGGGAGGRYGLQKNAANSFSQMERAFAGVFGGGIPVVEGFRDYANQVKAWNNYMNGGPRAAKPGTSLHGSGIAIDLGGPFQNSGSAQHRWLRANGARFGWHWVGQQYGEPWHWEYRP